MAVDFWFELGARRCGQGSFYEFGKEVGARLETLVPDSVADEVWRKELRDLWRTAVARNHESIAAWFAERLAGNWKCVPEHRRDSFTRGVAAGLLEAEEID